MRRIITLLNAVIFLVAVQPGAMAMQAAPSHTIVMHGMDCGSSENVKCDHSMPMQKQGTPCKDMGNCLGMLGCYATAVVPAISQAFLPTAATSSPSWHLQEGGPSLTLQPDNPPPIA